MEVRHTGPADLPEILKTYAYARELMKRTGNPNQWGDRWPPDDLAEEDIRCKRSYAVTHEGRLCGVFAFLTGEDPTYRVIENGAWLNDEPYGVIHRIAGNGEQKGVLEAALRYCEARVANLRIDTHADNRIMQHLLAKYGYTKCGIIHVADGSPRIAYHKVTG